MKLVNIINKISDKISNKIMVKQKECLLIQHVHTIFMLFIAVLVLNIVFIVCQ